MQIKVLISLLFACNFIPLYASQDQDLISRYNLNAPESVFFDEQISKLQGLNLPRQEEALYFNFEKMMNNDVSIAVIVGVRDKVLNKIYVSDHYHSHDEARKILRGVSQYLSDESDQTMLQSMVRDLQVGQSRLYCMQFENE